MQTPRSLTTKEVARLCRVSDATVKRWAEAGLLRSERTNGGHRRFRADEVARFQRESGLGQPQNCGDETVLKTVFEKRAKRFQSNSSLFQTIVLGREEETAAILINKFMNGEPLAAIFDDDICPAMQRVGELWFNGELTIAQEHLATRTVLNAVQKLRSIVPVAQAQHGRAALCCTVESDFHELPTHLVQTLLESAGWEVLNFGANTPLYALAEEVVEKRPRLVCLSATFLTDIERVARDYREFRNVIAKLNVTVIFGGRVLSEESVRRRFPADLHAFSFAELVKFVARLD
jgi:MerR family transcriptional regulator, light-induced transcriptional regulator